MIRRTISVVTGLLALSFSGCTSTPVKIAPPRIPQGGRALSIAVASNNNQHMVVASETGGLFRTYDGGKSWQHLDGLPNFKTVDVAMAWAAPDTIIATTQPEYQTVNDGGIWRSTDGGGTWYQATNWTPSTNCQDRPGAYGISHMPLSQTFYVGTDCGIAVSTDDGATWSTVSGLNATVRSVLVINRTSGVAAADTGLWHLDGNGNWTPSQPIFTANVPVPHAFAAPWWAGISNVFFHASGDQRLWLSTDSGNSWTQVPAPSVNNREAFVRVGRSLTNDDSQFEVYYGDGRDLHRQTFALSGPTGAGTWINPKSDHSDPSDIAFDSEFRIPILLATDGGVHVTSDSGSTWFLTGGGYGGFDALQIAELTGQVSGTQQFLYFGTQDNSMWASTDGGASWPTSIFGEGRYIRAAATRVTGSGCGNCVNFVSQPGFLNQVGWPNAPDSNTATAPDTPFLLSGDSYIQDVANTATTPLTYDFFLTSTAGTSWSKSFSLSATQPKGAALVAGPANNPTVFQGIQLAGAIPNGGIRFGMVRASNLFSQPTVTSADGSATVAFGSLRTPIARYVVLGVDPNNPSHLLAPDVENYEKKFSDNGGDTWNSLPQLTQAVTSGGQYLFTVDELSLASVITWNPYDSCDILVGTIQNGILRSTDGGNTWAQIAGSKAVTYVTSFYFPPKGSIWVSTTGRGLWTLDLSRNTTNPGQCRFPGSPIVAFPGNAVMALDLATGSREPFQGLKDPSVCAACSLVVVRNGWITDLQTSDDQLRQVAISGGTISQLDRTGKETSLTIPTAYQPGDGKLRSRMPRSADLGSARVRGLIVDRNRILKVIVSQSELPFAPERTPLIFLYNASKAGSPSLTSGGKVRVMGASFLPTSDKTGQVRILFDGKVVEENVRVRPDGSFSVEIPVRHLPGEMVITAEQRDGLRLTMARALIDISAQDAEK